MKIERIWTQSRLAAHIGEALGGRKLIVVSNREPYTHVERDGRILCIEPAGGVTSALKPIVAAARGAWVAHGCGSGDAATADARGRIAVPPNRPAFTLRRVTIPDALRRPYYDGLANQALWPLCHHAWQRPVFRASDWRAYRKVNELFANAVLDEIGDAPAAVFVQDYHLGLLPRILKDRNADATIAQFWHIPWPAADIMETFPWLDELLQGLLANDVLGFHLTRHAANFQELAAARGSDDGGTRVVAAPIGIDFERHAAAAASPEVDAAMTRWRERLGAVTHLGIGIDRIDYTKGIPERLRALGILLERVPPLRGHLTLVQIAVPTRSTIAEYARLEREIEAEAAAINQRWGTRSWTPVVLGKRNLPAAEMMALHRLSDFCLVTSLHDGMNLVAKEFVASRFDGGGALILSRFAGAAEELAAALQVNPFAEDAIADAMLAAIRMPSGERRRRMAAMRATVERENVYKWAAGLIDEMAAPAAEPCTQAVALAG